MARKSGVILQGTIMTTTTAGGGRERLTANFFLDELLVSETAERLGLSNAPTAPHERNLRERLAPVLQMIRDGLKRAVHVHSAYRAERVNKAVGGVGKSAHTEGLAADIRAAGMTARQLAVWIADQPEIMRKVDQLILETSRGVVHVSVDDRPPRGQVLTQAGGPGSPVVRGIV